MVMRVFFNYVFGLFTNPANTVLRIVEEPNKRLMTFYAIIWNNVLLLVFLGIVTVHRLLVWNTEFIKTTSEVLVGGVYFILVCNVIMFVVAIVHYWYLSYLKKKNDICPSILFSYMYLSVFILILDILAIVYHFVWSGPTDLIIPVGIFLLIFIFVFACEILVTYLKEYRSYLSGFFILFWIVVYGLLLLLFMFFFH
jgi:hypothetical protein